MIKNIVRVFSLSLLCSFIFVYSNNASANPNLGKALKSFKVGQYVDALKHLKNVSGSKKLLSTRYYLEGVCHAKTQAFDEAVISFAAAIKYGNKSKDLYYEYGQALYASNDLETARKSFKKSHRVGYKKSTSLYYVAHISQLLEETKPARDFYKKLLKEEKKDKSLIQVAKFQYAETLLSLAEKKKNTRRLVRKYVIPTMKKALKMNEKNDIGSDIKSRISEIEKRYHLDPNVMRNGKVLSKKRFSGYFSQDSVYDNNITQSTDSPTTQATQKDSYIYNTTLYMKYLTNFLGLYTVTPDIRAKYTIHSDRKSAEVFKNDAYSITSSVKNAYEHKINDQQASAQLNFEYNYTGRDRLSKKDIIFYARSFTVTVAEKFKYFKVGPSTFKFKYKDYKGFERAIDTKTQTISFDQLGILPSRNLWIFFMSADFIDSYNQEVDSTNSYLFRFDYIMPEIWPKYTLNLAFAYTMLDTKQQTLTRGTEKTYNPSIKLGKDLTRKLNFSVSYDYSKTTSLAVASREFSKHATTLALQYGF